jgi:hypothetical protein
MIHTGKCGWISEDALTVKLSLDGKSLRPFLFAYSPNPPQSYATISQRLLWDERYAASMTQFTI